MEILHNEKHTEYATPSKLDVQPLPRELLLDMLPPLDEQASLGVPEEFRVDSDEVIDVYYAHLTSLTSFVAGADSPNLPSC